VIFATFPEVSTWEIVSGVNCREVVVIIYKTEQASFCTQQKDAG